MIKLTHFRLPRECAWRRSRRQRLPRENLGLTVLTPPLEFAGTYPTFIIIFTSLSYINSLWKETNDIILLTAFCF